MTQTRSNRKGFTLVEMLMVLVLGTITVGSAVVVFMNSNRVHLAQSEQIRVQQTARAGIEILTSELREVSNGGGDILAINANWVTIRMMGEWSLVCEVDYSNSRFEVINIGPDLAVNDSIFLFAENDTLRAEDDVWLAGMISAVNSGNTCPASAGSFPSHRIDLSGISAALAVDSVRTGAPIRTFEHFTYGAYTISGELFVGREDSGSIVTPMVGPIRPGGLVFTYRDEFGATTTTLTDIAQIDISLTVDADVTDTNNNLLQDSVATTVFLRN